MKSEALSGAETPPSGPLPRPGRSKGRWLVIGAFLAALYVISALGTGFNPVVAVGEMGAVFQLLGDMWPPNLRIIPRLVSPFLETVQIAIVGSIIGGLLAVPVSLLAARNVTRNPYVYWVSKSIMNLLRTIPELLYAAVFVAAVGIGPFPGVLALIVFSMAIVAKLTSESIEAIDPGPMEAVEAVGGNRLEVIRFAVIPQVLPIYISYFLYVFEINIRVSTVLGVVGAGGIGQTLMTSLSLFQYQNAATIILATFAFVVLIDGLSNRLRARLV